MQTERVEGELGFADSRLVTGFNFLKSNSRVVQRLRTRWEHGERRVSVLKLETRDSVVYELESGVESGESSAFYSSARRLLRAVTGQSQPQTFNRYFRLDRTKELETRPNILKVLDKHGRKITIPGVQGALRQTKVVVASKVLETRTSFEVCRSEGVLRLTEGANREVVQGLITSFGGEFGGKVQTRVLKLVNFGVLKLENSVTSHPLGIDLAGRSHEVRKLLFKTYRGHMAVKGYDPEDVLQEIFKGLITRNAGRCPWDSRKSTFGYYVTMVIGCILTNYHRKMQRRRDREHLELDEGILAPSTEWSESSDGLAEESLGEWLSSPEHGGGTSDGLLAVRIMPMVSAGMQRREIVASTGIRESMVSRALAHLRKWSRGWALEVGVGVHERRRRRVLAS